MAAMVQRTCWCGKGFTARAADVARGWGKACCKAHAAHAREKKLDRHDYKHGGSRSQGGDDIDWEGGGWDAHKDSF